MRVVKQAEERRDDILTAAMRLFSSQEYESVTMKQIMDELSIAKGTIYHYFPSKQALLEGVIDRIIDEELSKRQLLISQDSFRDRPALEQLSMLLSASSIAAEHEQVLHSLHEKSNEKFHTRALGVYITRIAPLFAQVIERGCSEGVFHTAYPLESAELLLTGIQTLSDTGIFPWEEDQLRRRAAAIPSLIEQQLGAPAGSCAFLADT